MIRDVTRELCGEYKWTVGALKAIHEGSEAFLITILEYGNLAAIHGGRVTIMPRDIQLMMKIKEVTAAYKSNEPLTGPQAQERREAKEYDGNKRKEILMELRFQRGKMIAVQSSSSRDLESSTSGDPQRSTSGDTSGEPQPGTSGVCWKNDTDDSESDHDTNNHSEMRNNIISDDDSNDDLPETGNKRKRIYSESSDEEKKRKKGNRKDGKSEMDEQKRKDEKRKKDEQREER